MLREYSEAVPGLGERIIGWVEQQSEHRRTLENLRTKGAEDRMKRGQVLAAAVAAIGLIVSGVDAIFGNPWAAAIIAIVAVGGPTAAVALTRPRSLPVLPSSAVGTSLPSTPAPPKSRPTDPKGNLGGRPGVRFAPWPQGRQCPDRRTPYPTRRPSGAPPARVAQCPHASDGAARVGRTGDTTHRAA